MIEQLQHNARLVQGIARDHLNVEVEFDRNGVEWLDGYITSQHEAGDTKNFRGLVSTLGSFFGECIINAHGGQWFQSEHGWCVRFDETNAAFPFSKVEKHLHFGPDESVLSLFDTIPVVFKLDR